MGLERDVEALVGGHGGKEGLRGEVAGGGTAELMLNNGDGTFSFAPESIEIEIHISVLSISKHVNNDTA